MKKLLLSIAVVAAIGVFLVTESNLFFYKNASSVALAHQVETEELKQSDWYSTAGEYIRNSEYYFKQNDTTGYTCPNRAHNLRAFIQPGKVLIQSRINSDTLPWNLVLKTEGISGKNQALSAENILIDTTLEKGQLEFHHTRYTEQYQNNTTGLRQNFIIDQAPDASSEVRISIAVSGMDVSQQASDELIFSNTKTSLKYNSLRVWDANNMPLLAYFEIKDNNSFDIVSITENAVYPITIDPLISNGSPSDANSTKEGNQEDAHFGWSVATAGDVNGDGYSDVLIGAPDYDGGENEEGAVFVYYGSISGISAVADIVLESNQTGARMGFSVSTAGDANGDGYSDIIVGAPNYDNGETNEGVAFIYHGASTGLNTTPATTLQNNLENSSFGYSVAMAGNVNGDGYSDVIVGAYQYSNGQTNEGAFYVYHGSASGISTTSSAFVQSNQDFAEMGFCVASAGDVNGDGYSDVIVGAPNYNNGQFFEGVAFLYLGSASGVNTATSTILEANQSAAVYGRSVASAGDVNGDGYSDVIVGAFGYDNGQINEGAVFIYHGSGSGINTVAATSLESNQADANFGSGVASIGDVNGDGYADIVVGAYRYTNGQSNEGAAFVYKGSSAGIVSTPISTLESNQLGSEFGRTVASAGDVNGDGFSDIIIGVPYYDNGESNEGLACVFHGSASGVMNPYNRLVESNQANAELGYSVASAGDVNRDGYSDVIVGASKYDNGQTDEGAVFIFHGSATGIGAGFSTALEANVANANFGHSVASAGDVNGDGYYDVIVGAPFYENGQTYEGAVYVYHGSGSGVSTSPALTLQSNEENAYFGWSVSGARDVNGDGYSDIIIGAHSYGVGGSAFIYHGSGTGIDITEGDTITCPVANASFGWSVNTAGDVNGDGYPDVIIGAYTYSNGENNEGAAYLYHGTTNGISKSLEKIVESNQVGAYMGWSVSGAGDIDGDGYSDIVVGVRLYDNGQNNEGAAFVYYGAFLGIRTNSLVILESNQAEANMGVSVAHAGDVNGDGYSDIVVGADAYSNGELYEGVAFVYHGSGAGINTSPETILELNQENASFGKSVALAGDVNGDGYSDLVVGASNYFNGQLNEGVATVYHGNGNGTRRALQVYNTSTTTPLQQSNKAALDFAVGLYAKSFLGRARGKLVWEIVTDGDAFSGATITNSTTFSDEQSTLTNLGLTGVQLTNNIDKEGFENKIRARVKYDALTAITGQVYGPWIYPTRNAKTIYGAENDPLPIELVFFTAKPEGNNVRLLWQTASETNNELFAIERSANGSTWKQVGSVAGAGTSFHALNYTWIDEAPLGGISYYRLRQIDTDGSFSFSEVKAVQLSAREAAEVVLYPNPTTDYITIESSADELAAFFLVDPSGYVVQNVDFQHIQEGVLQLNLAKLERGVYIFKTKSTVQKIVKF